MDGETREVENVTTEHLDEPVKVYNFEVEDWHTYYVAEQGVLVHNMCLITNQGGSGTGSSRRAAAERKLADAAQGSRAEGILIGKDGDVPVHQSQRQLADSIQSAGAKYVGNTRNGDGQIYYMDTPYEPVEIRIMQQKPGQTNPYLNNCTVIVVQGSVGKGTGIYTYGNGARINEPLSKSERKAIGHTHGQIP